MVKQDVFAVEQFMDRYENDIEANMGETCCSSISFDDLIELVAHESDVDREALKGRLVDGIMSKRMAYSWIKGSGELKEAIASVYNKRIDDGDQVASKNIVVTNGAIGANFLLFYTLVDVDDHVIVVSPSYQQLSSVPGVFSGKSSNVEPLFLKESNKYIPDVEEIEQMIQPGKTKLLVINNPNNPTGAVIPNDVLHDIVELCKKHDMYVLCDEVYYPLHHSTDKPPKSIIQFGYKKAISSSSVSKAFSMAGLRLGWFISYDEDLIEQSFQKRHYNTISISMVDDMLATFLLENSDIVLRRNYNLCIENLKLVDRFTESSNGLVSWVRPQGGTTAFLKINVPGIDTYQLCCELAEKHNCLLVPGEVFGPYAGYVRLGFANSPIDLKKGLKILESVLKKRYPMN